MARSSSKPPPPPEPTKFASLQEIEAGIAKLQRRLGEVRNLDPHKTPHDGQSVSNIESAIHRNVLEIFGSSSPEYHEHQHYRIWHGGLTINATFHECQKKFADGIPQAIAMLEGLISRLEEEKLEFTPAQPTAKAVQISPLDRVVLILKRFHSVARQLRIRRQSRETLVIRDEYDVQDLLHALLKLDFDDIRSEEWTPSYAGSCSRMDFLLKAECIVVEAKKTRDGLEAKEIGEQLIVDIAKYRGHPNCRILVCFVYDPEGRLNNPRGLESDLERASSENLKVKVFIFSP
jgi:hypothetical protein